MINRKFIKYIKRNLRHFIPTHQPDFMILGAQKSGTTSLHYYLHQHPNIYGSFPKEVGYFNKDHYFGKSLEEYEKHFIGWGNKKYFESTPEYLYTPGTAKIIHDTYPDLKFIVVLRDPVKRAYSSWNMYREIFEKDRVDVSIKSGQRREGNLIYEKLYEGRKNFPSFHECVDIELDMMKSGEGYEPSFLRRGLYLDQLNDYWDIFGKENILVLGFKDFSEETDDTLKKIIDFLDVKDVGWSFLDKEPRNVVGYTEPISQSDKKFLEAFYDKPNRALFDVIGHINW